MLKFEYYQLCIIIFRRLKHSSANMADTANLGKRVPDRWESYTNIGSKILGTKFIAFKVPLNETFHHIPESFTPSDLMQAYQKLGCIIDLTYTTKYYSPQFFIAKGIDYHKILIPGHQIPTNHLFDKFAKIVDEYIRDNQSDYLIGVHCTHGVNRTGYMICRYMIERLNLKPTVALKRFENARNHPIERPLYVEDLLQRDTRPRRSTRRTFTRNLPYARNVI